MYQTDQSTYCTFIEGDIKTVLGPRGRRVGMKKGNTGSGVE